MKNKKIYILFFILLALCLTGCKKETKTETDPLVFSSDVEYKSSYDGKQGNAGPLQGNTIIISFFTSDKNTKWTDSKADEKAKKNVLKRLKDATEYLSKNAAEYGKKLTFIYDWEKYSDLMYLAEFEKDLVISTGNNYYLQKSLIEKNIKTQTLKNKYHADNIVYFFFLNTSFDNMIKPWTITHNNCDYCNVEFTNLFIRFNNKFTASSTFAHEMMHQFGAPDFYYANEYIPQNYVDYLDSIKSKDLMFYINYGSSIESKFTDLDAYYVGIAPRPVEANRWNLGKNEYEK